MELLQAYREREQQKRHRQRQRCQCNREDCFCWWGGPLGLTDIDEIDDELWTRKRRLQFHDGGWKVWGYQLPGMCKD